MLRPAQQLALALALVAACSAPRPRRPPGTTADWDDPAVAEEGEAAAAKPSEVAAPAPEVLLGTAVIGAAVEDLRRAHLGVVRDLELDARSGRVLAVSVELASTPEGASAQVAVPGREVLWSSRGGRPVAGVANLEASAAGRASVGRTPAASGEPRTVRGVVLELASTDDPGDELVLIVRDEENRRHRLLLAPDAVLERLGVSVQVDVELTARGLVTRDARGMLLVTRELVVGEREVVLRNAAGEPTWPEPPRASELERVSIVALMRDGLTASNGSALTLNGFTLDPLAGRVATLVVVAGGEEQAVVWSPLAVRGDGRYRIVLDDAPDLP